LALCYNSVCLLLSFIDTLPFLFFFFFFNDTATTEIYTLSLHDALPISRGLSAFAPPAFARSMSVISILRPRSIVCLNVASSFSRSEEHTSELQSQSNLVCRLLLEKKKKKKK